MKARAQRILYMVAATMALLATFAVPAFADPETSVTVYQTLTDKSCDATADTTITSEYAVEPVTVTSGQFTYTDSTGAAQNIQSGVADGLKVKSGAAGQISFSSGSINVNATNTASKDVLAIDASKFSAPGIYRYAVTEVDRTQPGVTYNTDNKTYYVDLYIVNNNGTLECQSVITQETNKSYTSTLDGTTQVVGKVARIDFRNEFTTYHVEAEKVLTGNQRVDTDTFKFAVNLSNMKENRTITVTVVGSDGQTEISSTSINVTGFESSSSFGSGSATNIEVGKDQTVEVHGLYTGEKCQIVEQVDSDSRGYKTKVSDGTTVGSFGEADAGGQTDVHEVSNMDKDDYVFTNDKSGNVPTGIFVNYMPFWIMAAVALVLLLALLITRRHRSKLDEF